MCRCCLGAVELFLVCRALAVAEENGLDHVRPLLLAVLSQLRSRCVCADTATCALWSTGGSGEGGRGGFFTGQY